MPIYKVTAKAGARVAGRIVPGTHQTESGAFTPDPNFELDLTVDEADYELTMGTIELKPDAPPVKGRKADALSAPEPTV